MLTNTLSWIASACKFAYSQDGWSVLAYPDEESKKRIMDFAETLDLDGSEKMAADELHLTLRYWKDPDTKVDEVKKWLWENLRNLENFECKAKKLKMLGKDKDALVIEWECKPLASFQKKMDSALQEIGVPPSDFPSFIAHTTLANKIKGAETKAAPDFEATFNKIKFKHGDEVLLLASW